MTLKYEVRLKDALYNLHPSSGADDEYCKGLVVGVVSALMATGMTFSDSLRQVANCLPVGTRTIGNVFPETWITSMQALIK